MLGALEGVLVGRVAEDDGTGIGVDFGALSALALALAAVFARLTSFSSSLLSSLLEVLSLLSSLAGCLRLLPTVAAADLVFLPLVDEAGLGGGASAMSTSESLSDEELSEVRDCLAEVGLTCACAEAVAVGVGTPMGRNRGRRFGGCSLAGLDFRTYSSVAVALTLLSPPNSAIRRRWTIESMPCLAAK